MRLPPAARGFVGVFVGALMFFGFVIGSGLLGSVGQALISFVFASAGLTYLWVRLDDETRRGYMQRAGRVLGRRSPGDARESNRHARRSASRTRKPDAD